MRKHLLLLLSVCCIFSVMSCVKDDPTEDTIQSLWGNYKLSNIRWSGLPFDLNNDNISGWDLLSELQNKFGYYEPDYIAVVNDGITLSPGKEWEKNTTAFNITVPYPYYVVENGKWMCTETRKINFTLYATENTFQLDLNCCQVYPGFNDPTNIFLSNVKEISLYVESFDEHKFKIDLKCTLPCDSSGEQILNENYLYYEFSK